MYAFLEILLLTFVGELLWGTGTDFNKDIKPGAPQMDGPRCQRLSKIFPTQILPMFPSDVQSCLKSYMYALDKMTYNVYTNRQAKPDDFWWDGRQLHALFVNFFGSSNVTASLFNLCVCSPFYAKTVESLSDKCGLPLSVCDFSDFVCESGHLSAKRDNQGCNNHRANLKTNILDCKEGKCDGQVYQFFISIEKLQYRGDRLATIYEENKTKPKVHTETWPLPEKPAEPSSDSEVSALILILKQMMKKGVELDSSLPGDITLDTATAYRKTLSPQTLAISCTSFHIGKWRVTMKGDEAVNTYAESSGSRTSHVNMSLPAGLTPAGNSTAISVVNRVADLISTNRPMLSEALVLDTFQNILQSRTNNGSVTFKGSHARTTSVEAMGAKVTFEERYEMEGKILFDLDDKVIETIDMKFHIKKRLLTITLETTEMYIPEYNMTKPLQFLINIPFCRIFAISTTSDSISINLNFSADYHWKVSGNTPDNWPYPTDPFKFTHLSEFFNKVGAVELAILPTLFFNIKACPDIAKLSEWSPDLAVAIYRGTQDLYRTSFDKTKPTAHYATHKAQVPLSAYPKACKAFLSCFNEIMVNNRLLPNGKVEFLIQLRSLQRALQTLIVAKQNNPEPTNLFIRKTIITVGHLPVRQPLLTITPPPITDLSPATETEDTEVEETENLGKGRRKRKRVKDVDSSYYYPD